MMAKRGAKTVVPRLRFPEFQGAAGWRIYNLSSLANLSKGVQLSSSLKDDSAQYLHFNGGVSNSSRTDKFNRSANTIIISEGGNSCGYVQFVYEPFWCGGHCYSVVPKKSSANRYLFYRLQSKQNEIMGLRVGSGLPNIPKNVLENFEVAYSDEADEQQKIADCLTSLDEVIAAQGRKVEALKAHKRGLMQQLFPREGETRPRLRFPEFRDVPEWIIRPLGELMVIGSSRRVHESDWTISGVPFYRAREIVALGKGEPINPLFISETLYDEYVGFTGAIEEGQLLVTGVGSIGSPYLVKKSDRFYFKDGNIIWLKNNQADVIGDFLFWLFESGYVQNQIVTMAGVGTVGTYTIENAKRTVAIFPADKCEQQRIADCLTSLDTQITAESTQLAALKTHKQGLMQQLFPTPEAA